MVFNVFPHFFRGCLDGLQLFVPHPHLEPLPVFPLVENSATWGWTRFAWHLKLVRIGGLFEMKKKKEYKIRYRKMSAHLEWKRNVGRSPCSEGSWNFSFVSFTLSGPLEPTTNEAILQILFYKWGAFISGDFSSWISNQLPSLPAILLRWPAWQILLFHPLV